MPEWEVIKKGTKEVPLEAVVLCLIAGIIVGGILMTLWMNNYYICTEYQKICAYRQCQGICYLPNGLVCSDICVKWKTNEDSLPKNETQESWHSWDESPSYILDNYTHYGANTTITISNITTTTITILLDRCRSTGDCDQNMSLPGCKALDCNSCCCDPSNVCWCTAVYCADLCGWTYNGTDIVKTNQTRVWNKDTEWWECK
jgi:hypothetical protein